MPTATRSSGRSGAGGRATAMYDSIACESASMPEWAVTERGHVRVSSGSQIAVRGIRYGLEIPTFMPSSGSPITETGVTSEPVPAVVGSGDQRARPGPGTRCSP